MEGFRELLQRAGAFNALSRLLVISAGLFIAGVSHAQSFATPGPSTNIVGITPNLSNVADFQAMQQQEPSCVFRPGNKSAILCAFNDMRAADLATVHGDAWIGLGMTIDQSETWFSRLAPGFKGDGARSINQGFAADPSLIAIPGNSPGMAGLTYIAGERDKSSSVLAFQRLVDFPKEDEDFWKPEDFVRIVATSSVEGGFIDKAMSYYKVSPPSSQGEITQGIDVEDEPGPITITTPTGTILVVYTVFPQDRDGSILKARRSQDNGVTWSDAVVLADSELDVTGASITQLGNDFLIAYRQQGGTILVPRRRGDDDDDECDDDDDDDDECGPIEVVVPDAMVSAVCTDGASLSCSAGHEIMQLCPFDQPASGATFRTFDFPWLAWDGSRAWAFATDRRFAGDASCTPVPGAPGQFSGKPRVVAMSTVNGTDWVGRSGSPNTPIVIAPRATGFQVKPVARGATSDVYVAWTDTTLEEEQGLPPGNNNILINDYSNGSARVFRKADMWMTRLSASCSTSTTSGCTPIIEEPLRVSSYKTALETFQADVRQEVDANTTNLRTHSSGLLGFLGDYDAMAVMPLRKLTDGTWIPNQLPPGALGPELPGVSVNDDVFLAWGDNRDVEAPFVADPESAAQLFYTPPLNSEANPGGPVVRLEDLDPDQINRPAPLLPDEMLADGIVDNDPTAPNDLFTCTPGSFDYSKSRDTNVYSSFVRGVPSLVAPTPVKPLSTIQRMYALEVNGTNQLSSEDVCLHIVNQPNDFSIGTGLASFYQLPAIAPFSNGDQVDLLDVELLAGSSASRSVFVTTSDTNTVITVNLYDGACPATTAGPFGAIINSVQVGDGPLLDPAYCDTNACDPVAVNETHEITLAGPVLEAPVFEAPSFEAPSFEAPVLEAPVLEAPSFEAPSFEAPSFEAPVFEAPSFEAPSFEAPVLEAPSLEAPSLEAGTPMGDAAQNEIFVQDVTYVVSPAANVVTTFSADVAVAGLEPSERIVQLIAWTNNAYTTTNACFAVPASNQQILAYRELDEASLSSVTLPSVVDGAQDPYAGELTFTARPDQRIGVTVRIWATGTAADRLFELQAEQQACRETPGCDPNSGEFGARRLISFGASAHQCNYDDAVVNTGNPIAPDCLTNGDEKIQPDLESPIITTPGDLTIEADSAAGTVVDYIDSVTVTDNVDTSPFLECLPASGSTFGLGGTTVTCYAEDFKFNSSIETFTISIVDTTPPSLPALADIGAEATSPSGATVTFDTPIATDTVDGAPDVTCSPMSGTTFAIGTTAVSCTATDNDGNSAAESFIVTVSDSTAPSFPAVIPDVTAEATGPLGAIVNYALPTATDVADPSPVVTCTPAPGTTFPLGVTAVACTATDADGNSSTVSPAFNVVVADTTIPTITLPTSIQVEPRPGSGDAPISVDVTSGTAVVEANLPPADGDGAAISFSATANDSVSGALAVTCDPPSGTVFVVGTTTDVNCNATDGSANNAMDSFSITVQDTTDPTFDVMDGDTFTIVADSIGGAIVDLVGSGDVVARDRGVIIDTTCSAVPDPNGPPPIAPIALPALLAPGNYDVTCQADGDTVLTVSVTVNVEINDDEAPELTIPAVTVEVEAGADGTATVNLLGPIFDSDGDGIPDASITVTDNVDADPDLACQRTGGTGGFDPGSPNTFGAGSHDISCTATDEPDSSGTANETTGGFTLFVNDVTGPEIVLAGANPLTLEAGDVYTEPGITSAIDAVDGDVSASLIIDDSALPRNPDGTITTVGSYSVTYTVSDAASNPTVVSRTVNVNDGTPPTFDPDDPTNPDPLPDITEEAAGPDGAVVIFGPIVATDIVDGPVAASCASATGLTSGDTFPLGATSVTCSATDAEGNTGSAMFDINVEDTTPPSLTADDINVVLGATIDYVAAANVTAIDLVDGDIAPSCYIVNPDNPSDPSDNAVPRLFDTAGTLTASCAATDAAGNQGSVSFDIEVGFPYLIDLHVSKTNVKSGSTIPIEWRYLDPITGAVVDSSDFAPEVSWYGPFGWNDRTCSGNPNAEKLGDDAGSSDKRYDASSQSWKFNWKTPNLNRKNALLVITPTGLADPNATECVRLR